MNFVFIFSFFFILTRSDCETIAGQTFTTQFERKPAVSYCFSILSCVFLDIVSETSGGAIAIRGGISTGTIHECQFINCQSKAQAACIYFSGFDLQTYRCCCINSATRYSSMFLSSELKISKDTGKTVVDLLTISGSTSQENAISCKNGDALIKNLNMSHCVAYGTLLAFELTEIENLEVEYTHLIDNKGDNQYNSIVYVMCEFSEATKLFHHGNYIRNTCLNGGYIFNTAAPTVISNSIFDGNSRNPLQVIRYAVTFDTCVFDGAEIRTNLETITNCQFLTQTAPLEFNLMNCSDVESNLKLSESKVNVDKNYFVHFTAYGYALMAVGIVSLVALISFIIFKAKSHKEEKDVDEDDQDSKENPLSTTPLIQQ